ncbi:MAG: hypothetical protein AAF587_16495 [Bacteroidota bacterium]
MLNIPFDSLLSRSLYKIIVFLVLLLLTISSSLQAQWVGDYLGDERALYAETKQVNQFFRRFNCEEAPDGERYFPGQKGYRDPKLRLEYLDMLFDHDNEAITRKLRSSFILKVTDPNRSVFLDFHGDDWFAEVNITVEYQGKEEKMTLFMDLEEGDVGSKWVFNNVYFEPFHRLFSAQVNEELVPPFIHPLSHELDFMEFSKVFKNKERLEVYASSEFQPDYLTLFLYESKQQKLRFKTVNKVKFHFFQVEGWYFELNEFNRPGTNKGWLISQMMRLPPGQKEILLKYIYHK